ncbi:DUF4160 domain-containing protein [Bosea sp. (in: a-proteobacteria)]|uniref:DUF4160 domain-containing protein n=1 Tax=Bosea sp. (in: a-proteobacteria) TaxID=1871050 RepID=UPI002FC5CA4D
MPTALRDGPYRFLFFSADCVEPAHMHVQRDDKLAKIWLHDLSFADTGGFSPRELARIIATARDRKAYLQERWNEHCKGHG